MCVKYPGVNAPKEEIDTFRKEYYEKFKALCKDKDFSLRSPESSYQNARTKLKISCKHKHIFLMDMDHLQRGEGCPKCAGRGKTIADLRGFAKSYGWKCMDEHYISAKHKYSCQ
jgi:hypothetical protein